MRKLLLCFLTLFFVLLPSCAREEPVTYMSLYGEGAPVYTIVRSDNSKGDELEAALLLRNYLEACGVNLAITTDWKTNPVSAYELVVGDTLREETETELTIAPMTLGEEGFFVKVIGGRVYMNGGSDAAVIAAVEHFLTQFCGYTGDSETGTVLTSLQIPDDYEFIYVQTFPVTDVTANGISLRDHVITWDSRNLSSYSASGTAALVQNAFYTNCGIWMEIVNPEKVTGPAVTVSVSAAESDAKNFEVTVDDSGIFMTTSVNKGFERGFNRFFDTYFAAAEGVVTMEQDFLYKTDIGSCVSYSEFGAVGDGVTNDMDAIIRTHEFANASGIPVKAEEGATYYIASDITAGAVIQTDTDWTGASFIIDDRNVPRDKRTLNIFTVTASKPYYTITDQLTTLSKLQENIGITLPEESLLILTDSNTKRYIRKGVNANTGSNQTDLIVVDTEGNVDMRAPLIWDYEQITEARVIPMDKKAITIRGGTFTTIAPAVEPDRAYYTRGISVRRSNVTVQDITHYVENEGPDGVSYSGILTIQDCANVTIENCIFTPHRTHWFLLEDGTRFSQGTYDIGPSRSVNLTFRNCSQTYSINDKAFWGIMGSNFCKNMVVEDCSFSRFDAHQGVANVTLLHSTFGVHGINLIGLGTARIENCLMYGNNIVNFRSDYGSHWEGEMIIRDCTWVPGQGGDLKGRYYAIYGQNYEDHDFGYPCMMPENITIENLHVDDSRATSEYEGIILFAPMNPARKDAATEKEVTGAAVYDPYQITKNFRISGYTSKTGKKWQLTTNAWMFRQMEVVDMDE